MATTIPHRELRNNSSDILRRAESGESFEVTNHGEVVAVIGPPPHSLRRRLVGRPAKIVGGFDQLTPVMLDHPIQATIDELRGER